MEKEKDEERDVFVSSHKRVLVKGQREEKQGHEVTFSLSRCHSYSLAHLSPFSLM